MRSNTTVIFTAHVHYPIASSVVFVAVPLFQSPKDYQVERFYRLVNKLPGPPPLPIIGNAHQLLGGFDRNVFPLHPFAVLYPM